MPGESNTNRKLVVCCLELSFFVVVVVVVVKCAFLIPTFPVDESRTVK